MKQETKDSIEWIKHVVNTVPKLSSESTGFQREYDNYNNALKLFDSLPELEEQLKHGGFIPDMNKTPCKDGDKVKVINQNAWTTIEEDKVYELKWENYKFVMYSKESGYGYDFDEELDFVKVE